MSQQAKPVSTSVGKGHGAACSPILPHPMPTLFSKALPRTFMLALACCRANGESAAEGEIRWGLQPMCTHQGGRRHLSATGTQN